MIVQIHVKDVYGNPTVYPANVAAKLFAEIAGTKTLTARAMMRIRHLGYTVEVLTGELPAGY